MTVHECIQENKNRNKVSNLWICPTVVKEPSIGRVYCYANTIDSRGYEKAASLTVHKSWIEDKTLCIIYEPDGEPIAFA